MIALKNWRIRSGIINSEGLTATEKLVGLVLVHFRNEKTGECTPSQALIARRAGLSLRAAKSALSSLEQKGVVWREPGPEGFRRYVFNLPAFSSYINRVHHVHSVRPLRPRFPAPDKDCIPAWEATKPDITDDVIPDGFEPEQYWALIQLCQGLPKPVPVEPWPANPIRSYVAQAAVMPVPLPLSSIEWEAHKRNAAGLMGREAMGAMRKLREQV